MHAAHYDVYGVPCYTPWSGPWTDCRTLIGNALAGGIPYFYVYGRPVNQCRAAIDAMGPYVSDPHFVGFELDLEPETPSVLLTQSIASDCAAYLAARNPKARVWIYSGKGMWDAVGMTGCWSSYGLHEFAGDVATWPASLGQAPLNQFGCWNDTSRPGSLRIMWQLRMQDMAPTRFGVKVDEDAFSEAFLQTNR